MSYGACFLFGTYLLEQLGPTALQKIVEDPAHGEAGLTGTLASMGHSGGFGPFFEDWTLANLLASQWNVPPRYSYKAFPVPPLVLRRVSGLPAEDAGALASCRVRYLQVPPGPSVPLTFILEPPQAEARLLSLVPGQGSPSISLVLGTSGTAILPASSAPRVLLIHGMAAAGYRLLLGSTAR